MCIYVPVEPSITKFVFDYSKLIFVSVHLYIELCFSNFIKHIRSIYLTITDNINVFIFK